MPVTELVNYQNSYASTFFSTPELLQIFDDVLEINFLNASTDLEQIFERFLDDEASVDLEQIFDECLSELQILNALDADFLGVSLLE